jgi:hypothetical protein
LKAALDAANAKIALLEKRRIRLNLKNCPPWMPKSGKIKWKLWS